MDATASAVTFRQVLRKRRFFALWLAHLVSSFGDWLAVLAMFSLVAFRLHGTPYQVAGIFIALIIPWATLGPLAGVFVDRWSVKRTMIASDLVRAVIAVLLALAPGLYSLYFLLFALSCLSCFFLPAQNVAIPLLVEREELLVANSLNAQTLQFNKIISPAVAGVLVAWAGEKACFYVDSASFVFSAAMISLIAMGRQPSSLGVGFRSVVEEFTQGVKFLLGHRALSFVTVAMVIMCFASGAVDSLIVVYVRDVLGAKSEAFGALVSLIGVGAILGAFLIAKFGQQQSKLMMVVAGMLAIGCGIFVLAAVSRTALALLFSVEIGLGVAAVLVPSQALVQEETPKTILGRVSSASMSLATVAQLVAVTVAGKIADWIGIRNLYFAIAFSLILIAMPGYFYARGSRLAETKVSPLPD